MSATADSRRSLSGKRISASGERSRQAEQERIDRMTPLERVGLALALGRRQRELERARSKKR